MTDEEPPKGFVRLYKGVLAVIALVVLSVAGVDDEWPRSQGGRALLFVAFIGVLVATVTPLHKLYVRIRDRKPPGEPRGFEPVVKPVAKTVSSNQEDDDTE